MVVVTLPCTTTLLLLLTTIVDPERRRGRKPVLRPPRSPVETIVELFVILGFELDNRSDVLSVDNIPVLVPLVCPEPVRLETERRAVFRSTTDEAEEVFKSGTSLLFLVEMSLVESRFVRFPVVLRSGSIIFTRGEPAKFDLSDETPAPSLLGVIVRKTRLEPLREGVDTVRVLGSIDWLPVAVPATPTVLLTGLEKFVLLFVERREVD